MLLIGEVWRDVASYEGEYRVSNLGRVRSLSRTVAHKGNGFMRVHERILKQTIVMEYPTVWLGSGHQRGIRVKVHRLVLEAFVGPCPDGMEARHFPDRNPMNNRLGNLNWGTKLDNAVDKQAHGTMVRGERVKVGKLTAEIVLEIRRLSASGRHSQESLGRKFGVAQSSISSLLLRKTWKHI